TPACPGVPLEALTPAPRLQWEDLTKGLRSSPGPQAAGGAAVAKGLVLQVRQAIRPRNYSRRTEKSYAAWVRRFLAFHRFPDAARLDRATFVDTSPTWPSSSGSAAPHRTRPSAPCSSSSGPCWIAIWRPSRRPRAPRAPCACP